ncbi:MAG: hypothetical protein EKK41_01370 [Hyphomicrobiales bacterium]|nr:MAG: hypothetical protein EKK41_01370 [Hyphomicrobiales bacterium]
MLENASALRPKLVIVEGIMGSGKSTTVLRTADRLTAAGFRCVGITEGTTPHPIRFDWNMPWEEVDLAHLMESSIAKWRAFIDRISTSETVHIIDGQLFHGNFTSIFLIEAGKDALRNYVRSVLAAIDPMQPMLIYFRQNDVGDAIRWIASQRGNAWVQYQTDWKLTSPYAIRRGLSGLDGLIELYRDYRAITDQLFAELDVPKVSIENSRRDWPKYHAIIDHALL